MREKAKFPEAALPLLAVWRQVVEEMIAAHPGYDTGDALNGRGDPVGPRSWGDGMTDGWKIFVVMFLPGPDGHPRNHNLSVTFQPDGRPIIEGGNHLGEHISLRRRREHASPLHLGVDLRMAARLIGLLPPEVPAESLGRPWEHTV